MGLFKKIGSKLKRVISLKNVTRAVTGQFGAIGKDVIRVVTTDSPAEAKAKEAAALAQNQVYTPPVEQTLPPAIDTLLSAKGAEFSNKLTSKIAQNPTVQNLTDSLVTTGIKAYWLKYRNWILGFLFALVLFFIVRWAFFRKSVKRARR